MPTWSGTPVPITRMLGQVDVEDATNLPSGCAAVCRNTDFTRDTSGISPYTRAGNCMTMEGSNSPGTGLFDFQYEPISSTDPAFQMPLRFTLAGLLEREFPAGTGRLVAVPAGMYTPPTNSHKVDTQAGNIVWSAYSNLKIPTAGLSGFNPKTLKYDPMGMKPYGFRWIPLTFVYKGEVCTPSNTFAGPNGNGHTYQAQNDGWTGGVEVIWPAEEDATVTETVAAGVTPVTWQERTMVIANRVPAPSAPVLTLVAGGSTFPASRTVYVLLTFVNGMGETVGGTVASVTTTAANQSVTVVIPKLVDLPGWLSELQTPYAITGAQIYEVDVTSSSPQPAVSRFEQVAGGPFPLGTTQTITGAAISANTVPTINSARITPGQLPTPVDEAVLTRDSSGGSFVAGRDVWIRLSYSNGNGETPVGPSNSITDTLAGDAIQVTLSALDEYPQLVTMNVYEADVATGAPEPPSTAYSLVGSYSVPSTVTVTDTASGPPPVTMNGTGPGGNIAADTETGGINGTQGYRFAVPGWINRNETFSGFTAAAVSQYDVDEDGWEIAVFKVPIGPANVIGRAINWTTADSTRAGGFWWIGLVNLQVPSQNIVYANAYDSDGITIIPTVFLDNVTTTGTFNFSDEYLESSNNTTDRLRVVGPPQGVRVDYLKTCDRIAVSGVPGIAGPWVSLAADYESYYGDTSPVPIPTLKGETEWGCIEFRNQIFVMRSQSGLVMTPGTGDPASWDVSQRWGPDGDSEGVGPCGPRAFAACAQFLIFVHRTGVYRYDGTAAPDMMTKEIPRKWGQINWAAGQTISVMIDNDTHTVRIQVPLGNSLIPNEEFCLSYIEGWLNPIKFSPISAKESGQEAARRWCFNDVSAFICRRMLRTIPNPPPSSLGPDGTPQRGSDFAIAQLCYASATDGVVNARTPGRYDDNGTGIDWKYQTVSASAMMKPSKPEGVITNALGFGDINVSFVAGRQSITGQQGPRRILKCPPMSLLPNSSVDFTRKPARALDEYWSVLYDNGKQPGTWASVKSAQVYIIPVKEARGMLDSGR